MSLLLLGALLSAVQLGGASRATAEPEIHALLDVPYMAQTTALCGGAALAMVLRYWGDSDVFPQDFADLVGAGQSGIPTSALSAAVRGRGWQAVVVQALVERGVVQIRSEIDQGRPLIALVEVAPRTYHYVVIVGATDQEVVLHDPARAPFQVLAWTAFDRAWSAAGRWLLLVLPPSARPADDRAAGAGPALRDPGRQAARTPCDALVDQSVHMGLLGDRDGAELGLVTATIVCPDDPAGWRELAGWRFSQSRWLEAEHFALIAVHLAPDDPYGWQLVATSRYLSGDPLRALAAWNHTDELRADTVDIHGAGRTRQPVVLRVAGLRPRQLLTPEAFGRAVRRLRELPASASARMTYAPVFPDSTRLGGGLAKIDISLDERPALPHGWMAVAVSAARDLALSEIPVDMPGFLGAGEMQSVAWRWAPGRPRVAFEATLPSPHGLPGFASFDVSWERQSYATTESADSVPIRETRRHVGLHVGDWATRWLRWQAGAALDRLREHTGLDGPDVNARDYFALDGTVDLRALSDRVALEASAGWWGPFAGGDRFGTGGLLAAWRSTDAATRPVWSTVAEIQVASRVAPLALWHGAGTGQGREPLLRAHPLFTGEGSAGVVTGPVFGRQVAHASLEYAQPVGHALAGGLAIAAFADAARAWRRLDGLGISPLYVDVGTGVRLRAPGARGTTRIDLARGLRGGGFTLSVGWGAQWPH